MKRRHFFSQLLKRILQAAALLGVAYPAVSFMVFRRHREITVVFRAEDRSADVSFKEGAYLVIRGDEFYALSAECTHLGCTLNFDPVSQRFRCPCHGSIFSITGKWLAGPAGKDLKTLSAAARDDGRIVVTVPL